MDKQFVCEGVLHEIKRGTHKSSRHVFLFTDMMILATAPKKKSGPHKLKFKSKIALDSATTVIDVKDSSCIQTQSNVLNQVLHY